MKLLSNTRTTDLGGGTFRSRVRLLSGARRRACALLSVFVIAASLAAQTVEAVASETLSRKSRVPGELLPYLKVPVLARVTGFVEAIDVDRGSAVQQGQVLAKLSAPELAAQIAEAEAKVAAVEAQRAEAQSKLLAAQSTYERLKKASETPGVVAQNEVVLAEKAVDGAKAQIAAIESAVQAARAAVKPWREMEAYLEVKAPFAGTVTERLVHPGSLVGPQAGNPALVVLEQLGRLRLVAAVPEADAGNVGRGAQVSFRVPAFPGQTFQGTVARVARVLDAKTRTLPVEIDVANPGGRLGPGMYTEVDWPVKRAGPSLLAPVTAEWVNVAKGVVQGERVEVMGALQVGDLVVRRATDEIRDGQAVGGR
jgi:RND family efflux transporter MFP subunit